MFYVRNKQTKKKNRKSVLITEKWPITDWCWSCVSAPLLICVFLLGCLCFFFHSADSNWLTLHSLNYRPKPLVGLVYCQFISQDLQKKKEQIEEIYIHEQRELHYVYEGERKKNRLLYTYL